MIGNKITKNARKIFAVTTIAIWSYILINQLGLEKIDIYNAWWGYSLTEIINMISNPADYQNDIVAQEMISSFTTSKYYSLLALLKSAGIAKSLTIQKIMTCLEVIVISIAGYLLPSIRKKEYRSVEGVIGMILISIGCTMTYGWGGWGWGLLGQTYIFPYAIWIFSAILASQGRLRMAGVLQAIGAAIHPIIGLLSAISTIFIVITNKKRSVNQARKTAIIALLKDTSKIIGPTILYLAITALTKDSPNATIIDNIDFIKWTKSTSFHWYPWTEGLFKNSYSIIFPYTTIIFGAIVLDAYRTRDIEASNFLAKTYPTLILITVTSIAGVIASELLYNQVLVKLAIFRISKLGLILAMPIYIEAFILMFEDVRLAKQNNLKRRKIDAAKNYLTALAGTIYIISSLFEIYLWPFLAMLGITLACFSGREILTNKRGRNTLNRLSKMKTVLAIALAITTITIILTTDSLLSSVTSGRNLVILSGIIAASMAIKLTATHRKAKKGVVLSSIFILLYGSYSVNIFEVKRLNRSNRIAENKRVKPYYDIQVCANAKTPKNSIIMPPLDRAYGWRSTSERQSTGTARDWATTWIYTSNKVFFEEGRNRLSRIGMNSWLEFKHDNSEFKGNRKFNKDLKSVSQNTNTDELLSLGKELGASHVVIEISDSNNNALTITKNNVVECENEYYQLVRTNNEKKELSQ